MSPNSLLKSIKDFPKNKLSDKEFDRLSLLTFEHQFQNNSAYRKYCKAVLKGEKVQHWSQIPAIPIGAFKSSRISCFNSKKVKHTFMSSGTTQGNENRSKH